MTCFRTALAKQLQLLPPAARKLNKRVKTPVEKIQAAADGEMCVEQAEKLRIIRSHMDSLELCKADLDSLILTIAEKYLPQLNLVMTALGIQAFATIGIIS